MSKEIMKLPAITGTPNAYEKIVQIWLDSKGYITTTGRWFWIKDKPDKTSGYKDIDILGLKENETAIVSVTTCLDDKIRLTKEGVINQKMYDWNIIKYFSDVIEYLENTPEYNWTTRKKIKKILFYFFGMKNQEKLNILKNECLKENVDIISISDAVEEIKDYISKFTKGDPSKSLRTESSEFTLLNLFINKSRRKSSGLDKLFE